MGVALAVRTRLKPSDADTMEVTIAMERYGCGPAQSDVDERTGYDRYAYACESDRPPPSQHELRNVRHSGHGRASIDQNVLPGMFASALFCRYMFTPLSLGARSRFVDKSILQLGC